MSRQQIKTRPWTLDGWVVEEVFSGIYEKYVKISPGDVVIDAGAHIGAFAWYAVPKARIIYSFEPYPDNFEYLLSNTSRFTNVQQIQAAVSDTVGENTLHIDPLNTGGHVLGKGIGGITVKTVTIDTFPVTHPVNFIKIDAEGSELLVLQGAERTLINDHPKIAAEIHSEHLRKQVINYLGNLGYTVAFEPYGYLWFLWAWKEG